MTLVSDSIFRQGAHSSCRTTRAESVIGRTLTSSPNTLRRSRRLWREQVTGRTLGYSLSMRLWYQICDTTSSMDTVQRPLDEKSYDHWLNLAEASALPASSSLYEELRQLGYKIFLLTGWKEYQGNVTEKPSLCRVPQLGEAYLERTLRSRKTSQCLQI